MNVRKNKLSILVEDIWSALTVVNGYIYIYIYKEIKHNQEN